MLVLKPMKQLSQRTAAQLTELRNEISGLELEITEHRRPAEELNDDFHNYVGHKELQLNQSQGEKCRDMG